MVLRLQHCLLICRRAAAVPISGRRNLHSPGTCCNVATAFGSNSVVVDVDRSRLRNIGIIAHIDAGKTTTTERFLYHAGRTNIVGDVDRGNTVTDYLAQERDRGITITSAAVTFDWKKHRVNLIDTPGHVDFTIEVERSLSVLDGAVTIIDASAGVEAQTITVWNQATKYKLPNIIYLNKYDRPQSDYKMCLKDLKNCLGINAQLIQLPVKSKKGTRDNHQPFKAVVDIIREELVSWPNSEKDNGTEFKIEKLSEASSKDTELLNLVAEKRERLISSLADIDDQFASHVIECDRMSDVQPEQLIEAVRRATLSCQLSPVLLGSSFKYIGVQQLMDALLDYLPSPIERELQVRSSFAGRIVEQKTKKTKTCAFIFKIMHDKRLGPLTYLRVCSGSLTKLQRLLNLSSLKVEQVKKVYRVFADELKELEQPVEKDDIVVVTGIQDSKTGDILTDQSLATATSHEVEQDQDQSMNVESLPFSLLDGRIIVPKINRIEPVYLCTIESRSISQQLKMEHALECLAREDPSFIYEIDERGVTTARGMGKLHLEIARDRMKTEYGIDSVLGPLQISYRETIQGSATEEFMVDRLVNGVKCVVHIRLYLRSKPESGIWSGKMLRLDATGESTLGKLRPDHRKAIERGFISAFSHGPSMGFPMIDCDVLLLEFKANYNSNAPIISSAASQCLTNAIKRCSPTMLEPIMALEVICPKEFNGVVLSDIVSIRRGVVESTVARENGSITIRSRTPLSTLANYSEFLRITTSGRGSFSMEVANYSAMSESDKQNIIRL